jgi:multidrug efflux system membrane fusion protein
MTLSSCSEQKQQEKEWTVPVETATALEKDVPIEIHTIGEMEAYSSVEVKSQVDGPILKVHFGEGQYVRKGELLFTIDPRPFEVALRRAEAALARDMAQYENAVVDAGRYEELVKKGYVARAQYDQYRTAAEALKATVEADAAAVEDARIQLGYCRISAPITGKTGNISFDQGNIVKANGEAGW